MYKAMIVCSSEKLKNDIVNLPIWGAVSGFEIAGITDNGDTAYKELKKQSIDLILTQTEINGLDSLKLLRTSKAEGLCSHVAFFSETADFEYARQGIILGAFDYFIKPFEINQFYSMFTRIKNEYSENSANEILFSEELLSGFEKYDSNIADYVDTLFEKITSKYNRESMADKAIKQLFESFVEELFAKYEWLCLYLSEKKLKEFAEENQSSVITVQNYYKNKLVELYGEYIEIFPKVQNEKISEIILYIIKNPEGDLKQKTIANRLYVSNSYLSTVFSAHTGKKFVDYITAVRMKRASWLLCNTELKITEIAERLDYKDISYFSRIFKKIYKLSPSEYRTFENCVFDI